MVDVGVEREDGAIRTMLELLRAEMAVIDDWNGHSESATYQARGKAGDIIGALGRLGDERAVPELATVLHSATLSHHRSVQRSLLWRFAAEGLGRIGGSGTPILIEAASDSNTQIREAAAWGLRIARAPAASAVLLGLMTDSSKDVRWPAILAVAELDTPQVVARMDRAIADNDLALIADANQYFVRQGTEESEEALLKALEHHGDISLVTDLLNSGNARLQTAARSWATARGREVRVIDGESGAATWGSAAR